MDRVRTSESVSRAGLPVFGGSEEHSSFHQSSTITCNETKKESRSIAAPSFGESLVQHKVWAPSPSARVTHQPSKLWPYTQDEDQVKRIHAASALHRPEKSGKRADYLQRSIVRARENTDWVYEWEPSRSS